MPFLFWEAWRCWELKQFQISLLLEVPSESQKENQPRNSTQFSTNPRDSNCSGFKPDLHQNDSQWNFIMWWVLQEEFVSCKSPPFHRSHYFDTKLWSIIQLARGNELVISCKLFYFSHKLMCHLFLGPSNYYYKHNSTV